MFEQVASNSGEKGIERASRIFYVVAVLNVIAVPVTILRSEGGGLGTAVSVVLSLIAAALAFVTGRGIENQRRWAMWVGVALALISLPNIPVGTIVGIAILVYLTRAHRAGLLNA